LKEGYEKLEIDFLLLQRIKSRLGYREEKRVREEYIHD